MQQVHPCPPAVEGGDLALSLAGEGRGPAGHLALSCCPAPAPPAGPADSGCPPAPTPGPCTRAGASLLFFFWPLVLPHFSFMMTRRAHEDGPLGLRQTPSGTVSSLKEMALVFPINCLGSGPPSLFVRDPEPRRRGVGGF